MIYRWFFVDGSFRRSCHANWRTRWSTYLNCYFSQGFNTLMLVLCAGSLCFDECVQRLRRCIKWSLYSTEFLCSELFVVMHGLVCQLLTALSENCQKSRLSFPVIQQCLYSSAAHVDCIDIRIRMLRAVLAIWNCFSFCNPYLVNLSMQDRYSSRDYEGSIIIIIIIIIESIVPSRNIGCLWVLSTSVYSAAKNLSSFQLLPISLITDLLQLFLGLPLFLFLWGFQSRADFGISPSSFLNVRPIHLNFLFLIFTFTPSCPVTFHTSLLEIIFGHHILYIYLRHLLTKVCILAEFPLWQTKFHTHTKVRISHRH